MTEEDIDKLEAVGVDFSKLAAGLAAAVAGADVDTAAGTAENAAQNNAVDTFFDALFVLADAGKITWGYIIDDDGMVNEGLIDLSADSAAMLIPFVPAGTTRIARIFQKAASKSDDVIDIAKRSVTYSEKQLKRKFKHAGDFGIEGKNYNPSKGERFRKAIDDHVRNTETVEIKGTYRGQDVVHYVNPKTGNNVIKKPDGEFISGWKLKPDQLKNVLTRGKL
ncbi:colicin D domain-containing protein [Pseudodesulfovibrio piezophilus]